MTHDQISPLTTLKYAARGKLFLFTGLLMLLLIAQGACTTQKNPVAEASASVFRLLAGEPVGKLDTLPENVRNELSKNGKLIDYQQTKQADGSPGHTVALFYFVHEDTVYINISSGSAYLISENGHFVTNNHVVEIPNAKNVDLFLITALSPKPTVLPANLLWTDQTKDLAVVQVDGLPPLRPFIFADINEIDQKMNVNAIGFPGASDQLTNGLGHGDGQGYLTPKIHSGTLTASYKSIGANVKVWEHSAPMSPGDSGGPLVNECAQVVGTNNAIHAERQNIGHAISLEELIPELKRLKIPFKQTSGPCEPADVKAIKWIYRSLAVFGFLMIAFMAYLIHLKRQIKKGQMPQIKSRMLRDILGVDKAGLKYAGPEGQPSANHREYGPGPINSVVLKSRTSLPDITLEAGRPVVIGALKEKAQVVINNKYISSAHLKLSYDGNHTIAEDLQSSNGTFINGVKISGPTALQANDTLTLTSQPGLAEYIFQPGQQPGSFQAAITPLFPGAKQVGLRAGSKITIGRDNANEIVINDVSISKQHCQIELTPDGAMVIQDLGSKNGTFVDGVSGPVTKAVLSFGQSFYLGDKKFSFKIVNN